MQEVSITINDECSLKCKYCFKKMDLNYSLVKSLKDVEMNITEKTKTLHIHVPEIKDEDVMLLKDIMETYYNNLDIVLHINMTFNNIQEIIEIKLLYPELCIVAIYNSSLIENKKELLIHFLEIVKYYNFLKIIPYFSFFKESENEIQIFKEIVSKNDNINVAFFKFNFEKGFEEFDKKIRVKTLNGANVKTKNATCKTI